MVVNMKGKITVCFFLLPFMIMTLCGCIPLVIGSAVGAAVVGGYAITKDSIQGDTDKPYNRLWNSALIVSKIRGTIKRENKGRGYIELESEGSYVWVELVKLTKSTTRLKVYARKLHLPNISLAQDLFVKIMEEAK